MAFRRLSAAKLCAGGSSGATGARLPRRGRAKFVPWVAGSGWVGGWDTDMRWRWARFPDHWNVLLSPVRATRQPPPTLVRDQYSADHRSLGDQLWSPFSTLSPGHFWCRPFIGVPPFCPGAASLFRCNGSVSVLHGSMLGGPPKEAACPKTIPHHFRTIRRRVIRPTRLPTKRFSISREIAKLGLTPISRAS